VAVIQCSFVRVISGMKNFAEFLTVDLRVNLLFGLVIITGKILKLLLLLMLICFSGDIGYFVTSVMLLLFPFSPD